MTTRTRPTTTKPAAVPQATQSTDEHGRGTDARQVDMNAPLERPIQPAMAVLIVRNDGTMETAPGVTAGVMLQIAEQLRQFALSAPIPTRTAQPSPNGQH